MPRPWKGLDGLVSACREASRADPRIRLVLIGPPRSYAECLGPGVRSIGMVPLERVARLVSACDIYAVTPGRTAFSETQLPTKVFDGMAMGRAIVASSISDIPRVLGKGAVMVAPGSPDQIARSILRLAADEKLRRKLGKVARKIYLARWSTDRMEERVVPAIGRLLGEGHPLPGPG
jgi:glycosyltransferase involved in cell wall biosynthesis